MNNRLKVFFRLEQDIDGYPPVDVESVWAIPTQDGLYVVDNIPFFSRSVALGDKVDVRKEDDRLWYQATVEASSNSLIRVVMFHEDDTARVRQDLESLGCSTELDAVHKLIAVNVPPEVLLRNVQQCLASWASDGRLDYEEPILRHA